MSEEEKELIRSIENAEEETNREEGLKTTKKVESKKEKSLKISTSKPIIRVSIKAELDAQFHFEVKVNLQPLIFPLPPKISIKPLDTLTYIITYTPNLIKLSFKTPPLVSVNNLDTSLFTISEINRPQKLVFISPSTLTVSSLDDKIYLQLVDKSLTKNKQIVFIQNNAGEPEKLEEQITFLNNFSQLSKSLIRANGTTIIVYDENKAGIDESLAYLAVEIAKIRGYDFNPYVISSSELSLTKLYNVGTTAGIYVIKEDLCKTEEVRTILRDSLNGIMGYKYSTIIMPECLYKEFQIIIGGKPKKIVFENLSKEEISTLAYLASGLQMRLGTYDALANVNSSFEEILSNAMEWLEHHKSKDVHNKGEESELHRGLKAVAIKHLVEVEKIDEDKILVEEDIRGVKPDIYVKEFGLVIDAKTSYGVLPSDEIYDVQKKYSSLGKIWVVMRSIAVLLDMKGIIGRLKEAKKQGINVDVMIPIMDNTKGSMLMRVEDFISEGKKWYRQNSILH
ncbi:hypothetical protein EWF20_10570 [Sulfolobus sp. S-194]|uniref:hypothetical protein n=1 Tax=Sulfolobus sp. S-194 TaxID=2512240 RepID=UPI0014373E70|nr:hypothetical protein [Sulfolobus sp. S-194]QIW24535.1 hypothetical protein EWF20_10570 [Sulfolobus sp. S-194]